MEITILKDASKSATKDNAEKKNSWLLKHSQVVATVNVA
jgi:hypothetical protein